LKRLLRWVLRIVVAACVLLLLGICAEVMVGWRCPWQGQILPIAQPAQRKAITAAIKDYSRPEDDTFLSYPEWYIVWSYQEKADFQERHLPSGFPYFGAVRQYWNSYCCVSRLTQGKYPFNAGEQLMLCVIGASFSAEYVLKGIYEDTVGKLSEWTSGGRPVEEDQYAYRVAREYAEFVHVQPFYEFYFARHIAGLWRETRFWGGHPLRKWERKLFLTADYTVEASYCWLIEKLTHATYGHEPSVTYAWIDHANATLLRQLPGVKNVNQIGPNEFIVAIPRYQEFTTVALALAQGDVHFVEIAANSQIAMSLLALPSWHYDHSDAHDLFSTPILTTPPLERHVIVCNVASLHLVLHALRTDNILVEHIYDY
jgi:hypothetical protein